MFAVLLFAVMSALTAGAAARCPLGFVSLGRSCYLFSTNSADFAGANSFCLFFGSRLAVIERKTEDTLIKSYLLRHGKGGTFYIGGTDLRAEGIFTWERPLAKKLGYRGWPPGQPDNYKGNEHCMTLPRSFKYRWNDAPCDHKYRFICERRH
ncbi:perlucin-like [Haliotis rubra]|uniref:perlucin-like n=1 Tax=Haliotis rubra TaxID=36100 RepID=UPI001EE50D0B|nr:perlucin-like [Haliotis rubra]